MTGDVLRGDPQLDTLEAKGLIRLIAARPELEYLFRHGLVQDAAYGSLLKQERRDLHGRVGEALESLYPDRRGELAAVLGMHFEEAGDTDRALAYLSEAAHYALDRNALHEAFGLFDRAAKLLGPATRDESDEVRRRRVDLELGRAQASWSFRPPEDLIADLEAIAADAERIGDLRTIAAIHLPLALIRLQMGEPATSPGVKTSFDRITEIGRELGDPSLGAMPLAMSGIIKVFAGPLREGVRALEEAVPLLEGNHDFIGAAFARGALGVGYANLGEFAKAEVAVRQATEVAKEGDLIAQLDAQIAESMLRSARGQVDDAIPLARACIGRAEETGASACVIASSWVLGDLYHRQGRFEEAKATLKRGRDLALIIDRMQWRPTLVAWLGGTAAALGEPADGDWDEPLVAARAVHSRIGEAGILAKRGEARARTGDCEGAEQDYGAAIALLEAEEARPMLARALEGLGEAMRRCGKGSEAEAPLRRALSLFEELGIEREAAGVRAVLALGGATISLG